MGSSGEAGCQNGQYPGDEFLERHCKCVLCVFAHCNAIYFSVNVWKNKINLWQEWSLFTDPKDFFDILSQLEARLVFICVPLNYSNICCKHKTGYLFSLNKPGFVFKKCQIAGSDISQNGCVSSSIAERQGMKRGWFTYTDLCVLMEQSAWSQALTAIYQHFTKVGNIRFSMWLTDCFRCPLKCA